MPINSAGQIWRFLNEVQIGDPVLTYEPANRLYHLGVMAGSPQYAPNEIDALPVKRAVKWQSSVSRDDLSDAARGRLGAILTLFRVAPSAVSELNSLASGKKPFQLPQTDDEIAIADVSDPFEGLEDQAVERIKDKLLVVRI